MREGIRAASALAALTATAAACAMGPRAVEYGEGREARVTADGLHEIQSRTASHVFVRPGTDLGIYTEVMLDPVRIRYGPASVRHLAPHRMEMLEAAFRDAFVKQLEKSAAYTLVTTPGPQVLRIEPQIVDLDITAPADPAPSSRSSVYVSSSGTMTLLLDLSDSRTHQPLVRAASRRSIENPSGGAYETSPTQNLSDARIVFRHWALLLRQWLDSVRTIPPLPAESLPPPAS